MKKIFINAMLLGSVSLAHAQVISNGNVENGLYKTNYFLDASNFQGQKDASVGKLLGFPKTDLTKFKFNLDVVTDEVVLSGFDGVVVYNMAKGTTGSDAATQGKQVAVTPGFYYFSNPNGAETQSVANGQWVRLGAESVTGTATLGTLPKYTTTERDKLKGVEEGSLIYNTTTKQVEVYNGTGWNTVSGVATTNPGGGTPVSPGTGVTPPPGGGTDPGSGDVADLGNGARATLQDAKGYVVSLTYQEQQIQGKIDNGSNKVQIRIPYTGGNGGSYGSVIAQTQTIARAAQDGGSTEATLTIPAGQLASGNGYITAEVSTPSLYKVKMLAPGQTEKVAEFKVRINGQEKTVVVNAIGGIPDKNFGDGTGKHDHIYIPFIDNRGNTWLSQNVGATYANIHSPDFNPMIEAEISDKKAWGSGTACPDGFTSIVKNDLGVSFPELGRDLKLPGLWYNSLGFENVYGYTWKTYWGGGSNSDWWEYETAETTMGLKGSMKRHNRNDALYRGVRCIKRN
ncbi:hypothetical protein ACQ1P2_03630 [Ornithobacterium rhinotracheale]|uniref:hypothetical protein n=1 Tax=Ornithobacterium rhinotracheale TaxID=28251 RepID=UPI0040394BD7